MTLLELLLILILAPVGVCAIVLSIGWCSTVKCRLKHTERMFELSERAKISAITIQERQMAALDKAVQDEDSKIAHWG